MRSKTVNGITVKYMDEIAFAFNPSIIQANGENINRIDIDLSDDDSNSYSVSYYSYDDGCYADVREYVQSCYDSMTFGDVDYSDIQLTKMGKKFAFKVYVILEDGTETEFDFETFSIWGALKEGSNEAYNSYRELTWFKNFPFTFGLFSTGGSMLLCSDGKAERVIRADNMGIYNVPLFVDTDNCNNYLSIKDFTGSLVEITFDDTFDDTFRCSYDTSGTDKLKINVVDSAVDSGYYLRWVDRHGFYCYYLFKQGEEQRKVTSDGSFMRNNLLAYDASYGYKGYTGRQQMMTRQDTIPICVPSASSYLFDTLFDITTSPCVDLFSGYDSDGKPKWVSVTVDAGTYKKSREELQDFICQITMPETEIQKL